MIGNDLLRGVSGGEKKRVTVGEGLITNARFLALDEISTGVWRAAGVLQQGPCADGNALYPRGMQGLTRVSRLTLCGRCAPGPALTALASSSRCYRWGGCCAIL